VNDKVYLLPIGEMDSGFLGRIGNCLAERYLYSFKVLPPADFHLPHSDGEKQQHFSQLIFEQMKRYYYSDTKYLMGLTGHDLCCLTSDTSFGEVNRSQNAGLVSLYRLKPEYYGSFADRELLFQRALKEFTHQLGHLEGLEHCSHCYCVMSQTGNVMEMDAQESVMCLDCEKNYHESKSKH